MSQYLALPDEIINEISGHLYKDLCDGPTGCFLDSPIWWRCGSKQIVSEEIAHALMEAQRAPTCMILFENYNHNGIQNHGEPDWWSN